MNISLGTRGPHRVGVRELTLPSSADSQRQLPTSVWYPAIDDSGKREDAPHAYGQRHEATADLEPIDEPSALILFSHGNSGTRHQSTFLTTHLASWGYVVAAPDHVGNTFLETMRLETPDAIREAHLRAREHRPVDGGSVISALLDKPSGPPLPPLDTERIGVFGHSFGGWTAIKLCRREPRIRALCGLAPASEPFVGRKAFDRDELPLAPEIEALVLAGRDDVLVDLETSILPLHDRLGPKARIEVAEGVDHFHFCDGIEPLHDQHVRNPRPNQPRPTRPLAELLSEAASHEWLRTRVAQFFAGALALPKSLDSAGGRTRLHRTPQTG